MDDLRFYIRFNSISAISERLMGDIEKPVQWNPLYDWKDPRLNRGSKTRPVDQPATA